MVTYKFYSYSLHDALPISVLRLHPQQQVVADGAGVVDQDVDRAQGLDHGLHRRAVGDVAAHRLAADLVCRLLRRRGDGPVVHHHAGAHPGQRPGHGAADALAAARHQRGPALQGSGRGGQRIFQCRHANSTNSSSAFQVSTPGMCLAARLASTRPGPSSTTVVTCIVFNDTMVRAQSTGRSRWLASSWRRSFRVSITWPVALARIGNCGISMGSRSSTARKALPAASISGECAGSGTVRMSALRAPAASASRWASSTAGISPERPTWTSALRLAR